MLLSDSGGLPDKQAPHEVSAHTAAMSRGSGEFESYREFYLQWIATHEQYLQELAASLDSDMMELDLATPVSRVLEHYREKYEAKKIVATGNVLQMMAPSWRTPLENALLWLGGWRPTLAFQLAYAEVARQVEAELADIRDDTDSPTMASLSSEQLSTISNLQVQTVVKEDELSRRMAFLQQSFATEPFVSLARIEAVEQNSQQIAEQEAGKPINPENVVSENLKLLGELVMDAEALRLRTLEQLLEVLTVFQSAQFLVAAGNLRVCIRRLGQSLRSQNRL